MSRKRVNKVISCLFALWYVLAIIGFNTHICHSTGESFVTSVLENKCCADLHPFHICSDGYCQDCSMEHSENEGAIGGCCTDDVHVLSLTGELSAKEKTVIDSNLLKNLTAAVALPLFSIENRVSSYPVQYSLSCPPVPSEDVSSLYCYWRI